MLKNENIDNSKKILPNDKWYLPYIPFVVGLYYQAWLQCCDDEDEQDFVESLIEENV